MWLSHKVPVGGEQEPWLAVVSSLTTHLFPPSLAKSASKPGVQDPDKLNCRVTSSCPRKTHAMGTSIFLLIFPVSPQLRPDMLILVPIIRGEIAFYLAGSLLFLSTV